MSYGASGESCAQFFGAPKKRLKTIPERQVYVAWDKERAEHVVVKAFAAPAVGRREWDALLHCKEAAHIVQAHRFFEEAGRAYIVMEWLKGATLRQAIRRHGRFRRRQAVAVALNVLRGLDAVHRARFIHGDLHAGNVIVTDFRAAATKIIDFQHAVKMNVFGRARARRTLRRRNVCLAPESRQRIIDVGYDIYGVGYMLASMLVGREVRSLRCFVRHVRSGSPLWKVAAKAMRRDPARRFRSARKMMERLHDLC